MLQHFKERKYSNANHKCDVLLYYTKKSQQTGKLNLTVLKTTRASLLILQYKLCLFNEQSPYIYIYID